MSITIDLPPEVEEAMRAEASAKGVSEVELVRSLLEQRYAVASNRPAGGGELTDDFDAAMDELADTSDLDGPLPRLSDYAVSRAGIYEDHP